jgi:hypothetical protein
MATTKNKTKKAQVWSFLNSGRGITLSIAQSRFGVKNLRATISDLVLTENVSIKTTVDKKTGETRYTKVRA